MANRQRKTRLELYVSEEENGLLKEKMTSAGTENFSMYARKMLINGYIIKTDFSAVRDLLRELSAIGRNINQIAKRANETRNIYENDICELQNNYSRVKSLVSTRLVKIIKEDVYTKYRS